MIRFRQKEFVLQESHQPLREDQKLLPDPILSEKYGGCELDIELDKRYTKQYQTSFDKPRIKKLIKDLKDWHLYDDGAAGGNTHYLSEFSRDRKFICMSKEINKNDRLNYRIYAPEVIKGRYRIKIVLINCVGHGITGIGTYSE